MVDSLQLASDATELDLALGELSDVERQVALWRATGPSDDEEKPSAEALAKALDIDRATVFRILQRPKVRDAVSIFIATALELDTLPNLWHAVERKAAKDPKFAFDVIKWLHSQGISVFDGKPMKKPGPPHEDGATVTVPSGYDAMIRVAKNNQ